MGIFGFGDYNNSYSDFNYGFNDINEEDKKRIISPITAYKVSLVAFIMSLSSFVLCCGGLSPISFVLALIGLTNIGSDDDKGKRFAVFALIISCIGIIIMLCVSCSFMGELSSVTSTTSK